MAEVEKDHDSVDIKINRKGSLFKHICAYLLYGHLPRGADGKVMISEQTLTELKTEADFYGLDSLSTECDSFLQNPIGPDFESYFSIRNYIDSMLGEHKFNFHAFRDFSISAVPRLSLALKSLWVPFCAVDKLYWYEERPELSITDIFAAPFLSATNLSQNCTMDVTLLNTTVIDRIINILNSTSALKNFAPHLNLTLRPK